MCCGPRVSSTSSTPVSRTGRATASRRCSTLTTLARARATSPSSSARPPGRSGTRVKRRTRRPSSVSWRSSSAASRPLSTFPPETIATVVPSTGPRPPPRRVATPTAPAPSETSLARSARNTIAAAISSSRHGAHLAQQRTQQRQGQRAGPLDGDAVGDVWPRSPSARSGWPGHPRRAGMPAPGRRPARPDEARRAGRWRRPRRGRRRRRGRSPGPARDVLEQLESERPLSGDDVEIIEGMHEGRARLRAAADGLLEGLVHRGALQDEPGRRALRRPRPSTRPRRAA